MQANFVFLTADDKSGKVKLYFQAAESGDVLEIAWGNADYIQKKLTEFGVSDIDGLRKLLAYPKHATQEVYLYSFKDKDGKEHEGYTLDKPFPTASEPDKAIVSGKVVDVRDNGLKVAVIVDVGKGETFTVSRSYYVYDKDSKKAYPVASKRENLLAAYDVDDFGDLAGRNITFTRQKAGDNFYYEPAE